MIIPVNGRNLRPLDALMYWIQERYRIRTAKEQGDVRPWTTDKVFQETYFCNVHREDDKVTKFIRSFYSSYVDHPLFEYNIVLSRFLNWPDTLKLIEFQHEHSPLILGHFLDNIAKEGKVWGNAYVITTHGMPMGKAAYLCNHVLSDVHSNLERLREYCRGTQCATAAQVLQEIDGIGSFLAGQIVADLKRTPGHPLYSADDKDTFVVPGPGSMRGIDWICGDTNEKTTPRNFLDRFKMIRSYVNDHWPEGVPPVDNQDLQNCLCEFDKYCRVATASGRSKRKYNGR